MKKCELCKFPARSYCEADEACLCWDCDAKVHGANFLVARHTRSLLCQICQFLTRWKASGAKLGRTVSVCDGCANRYNLKERDEEEEEDEEEESEESEEANDDEDVSRLFSQRRCGRPALKTQAGGGGADGEAIPVDYSLSLRPLKDRRREKECSFQAGSTSVGVIDYLQIFHQRSNGKSNGDSEAVDNASSGNCSRTM
ncbi:hypothetical protein GH714_011293 [Hevea brasiliensis]|uniref:B box-type domain-containing protein n=1 Tax=Hevea brasiliensis TaxID=3981 RepID=A0A6A6K4B7_HEVBR|nr:hypothetical protein GH714_011293 [Hevea brasiliensis]